MDGSDSASSCSVRRGRRPHSTSRNFMHENRETSETPVAKPGGRSAGEGSGHTARMHVCEESHRGIVPMNHSNKGGVSSAESEEGRPWIKENTSIRHVPDTERDCACSNGWASVRRSRLGSAVTDLREEPDTLMSARPGLCGVVP